MSTAPSPDISSSLDEVAREFVSHPFKPGERFRLRYDLSINHVLGLVAVLSMVITVPAEWITRFNGDAEKLAHALKAMFCEEARRRIEYVSDPPDEPT